MPVYEFLNALSFKKDLAFVEQQRAKKNKRR
jgi:hypothetical protein